MNTYRDLSPLSSPTNLIVIDSNIVGYEDIMSEFSANTEILILDAKQDAIAQITEALAYYEEVSSLQIFSHGDRGLLQLGNTNLSLDNITEYQDELVTWQNVLTADSDILLYGCDVAEGTGTEFVDTLSQLTGADVAASTDLTGSSFLGGDGELEYAAGEIEAESVLSDEAIAAWDFTLANDYVVQTDPAFQKELVLSGLKEPTSMTFLPDNRMLFLQKNGIINIYDPQDEQSVPTPYLDLSENLKGGFEAGLLDIALDPNFGTEGNNFIYVYYSHKSGPAYRISRFDHNGNTADLNSELVLFEKPDGVLGHHDGGGLDFGTDGKLYLSVGDQRPFNVRPSEFDFSVVSDLSTSNGKIYRINPDGSAPVDNPFVDNDPNTDSNQDFVWAYGVRNAFRSRWDIPSNRYFIGDVGGNVQSTAFEEINLGQAGANYGWPQYEGISGDPDTVEPIFAYAHTGSTPNGGSVTGGVAYRGEQFPSNYEGAFFFGDYTLNWIRYLQFDPSGAVIDADPTTVEVDAFNFDNDAGTIVSLEQGLDGSLYYLTFGDFGGSTGTLNRISYNQDNQLPVITKAIADAASGSVGSTINFSAAATDADEDDLTYTWSFGNGDTARSADTSYTYNSRGVFTATLDVSDGTSTVTSEPITIQIGEVPDATILSPLEENLFRAGEILTFNADAVDLDETLTDNNFVWTAELIHNNHTHPDFGPITGKTFDFTVPTVGHGFSDRVGYRVTLTVTDTDGLFDREVISLFPEKVDLSFASNIDADIQGGVDYTLDGLNRDGPFVLDTAIAHEHQIIADEVIVANGIEYTFDSWSDGTQRGRADRRQTTGDATASRTPELSFIAPESDTNYTANYIITDTNVSANANGDRFTVTEDALNIPLDVLANDTNSSSGGAITITEVGATSDDGTVAINNTQDGLIYTPAADFAGIETFIYSITDDNGSVSQAEVAVAIAGTNDAPSAVTDSFNVDPDSTDNAFEVLVNDSDVDLTDSSPVTMEFATYEVEKVSTISASRATKVRHFIPTGELSDTDFIFDATSALGDDPHFHMMGMPEATRPNYLTQHNSGGNGQRINFTMAREDNQAFAFKSFNYTSGLFFPGANAGFTVTGTLANGGEISQSFAAAEVEKAFQTATLEGAGWQNVVSVRFEGDSIGTGTEVSQELNIDNLVVNAASDVLNIISVSTPDNGGNVDINGGGLTYTPAAGFEGRETFDYTIEDLAGETSTATVRVNVGATNLPVSDGLVLHLEADNGVVTNGSDLVMGWNDQSGLGNNLTGSGDPRLIADGLNGQTTIAFDGTGDKLENLLSLNDLPAGNSDRTIFFLAKYNSRGFGGFAYGNNATNQTFGLVVDNRGDLNVQAWGIGQDNSSGVDGTGAGWLIQGAKLEDGALTHYLDGTEIDSSNHTYNTSIDKLVVGAEIDSSPYLDMEVAGILVYDRALDETELEEVDSYLKEKYFNPVAPTNQAPVVVNDVATLTTGTSIDIDILNNDRDDGAIDPSSVNVTSPANGTVTVDPDTGVVTYTHDGTETTTDSFSYTVADEEGKVSTVATVSLTINPPAQNQAPVAVNDVATVAAGSSIEINILDNDRDDGAIDPNSVSLTQPAYGTATLDPDTGVITYIHNGTPDTTDSFTYTVSDEEGLISNSTTVDLTINHPTVDRAPTVEDDIAALTPGSSVEINILDNDRDDGIIDQKSVSLTQPAYGTATVDPNTGIVTYTHDGTETSTDSFTYTVADENGLVSDPAMVNLSINAPSSSNLPVSDGLVLHLEADSGVITDGNDIVTGWTDQSGSGNDLTGAGDPRLVTNGLYGQATIAFDGEGDKLENILGLTNLPAGNSDRTVFFLAKYNSPGYGGFAYGNDAVNQTFGLVVDNRGDLAVQAWGFGKDNSSRTDGTGADWLVQAAKLETGALTHYKDGEQIDSGVHTYNTSLDKLVVGAEIDSKPYLDMEVAGILVYDRALNEVELQQVNSYLEEKYFNNAAVPNQAPVVRDDSITVTAGSTIDIAVLNNDNDSDGAIDPTSISVSAATNGTVTADPVTGVITYTHDGSVTTSDRFTYTVADDRGAISEAATVDVTINPPAENQAPVATDDSVTLVTGASIEIDVLSNDNDRDSALNPASVEITQPTNGTATVNQATGVITYTHDGTSTTTDSFTYTVADNLGLVSNVATVNLSVNATSSNLPVTDGLVLHLEADSGVTTDGSGLVTGWTDQSGLGNNLTGSGDPRLITNELNGQAIIAFDGEGDKLENLLGLTGLPAGNSDRTVFFLAKYNSRGFGGFAYGNNAVNQTFGLVVDNRGDLTVQAWGATLDNSSRIDGTGAGWLIQGAKLQAGVMTHYLDGTEIDSGNHTYNTTLDKLVVGAEIDSSPYLDMEVGGIIVYDRALNEAELQQVNSYLEDKYGLA